MKFFKFGTVAAIYIFLLQTLCFTAFAEKALDMLNTLIETKLPGVSQTHENPVSILLYAEKVCKNLKDKPKLNFLNRKVVAAKSACDHIDFSILDEVSESDIGFIDLQYRRHNRFISEQQIVTHRRLPIAPVPRVNSYRTRVVTKKKKKKTKMYMNKNTEKYFLLMNIMEILLNRHTNTNSHPKGSKM